MSRSGDATNRRVTISKDDLESGFVRVLQEMVAAGWSDPAIGERVRELLQGWLDLIIEVSREAERRFGPLGPFPADEFATLVGLAFMGGESMLLLGFDRRKWPVRSALRRIGTSRSGFGVWDREG